MIIATFDLDSRVNVSIEVLDEAGNIRVVATDTHTGKTAEVNAVLTDEVVALAWDLNTKLQAGLDHENR